MLQLNGSLFLLRKRVFKRGGRINGVYSILTKDQRPKQNYVVKITVHKDEGKAWTGDVPHDSGPVLNLSPTDL